MSDTIDLRDPTAVCAVAGLEPPEVWQRSWLQSERSFQPSNVPFLAPEYLADTCTLLQCSPPVTAALVECAALVAQDVALQRLAWHLHWLVSLSGLDPQCGQWPAPPLDAHPANALLYGLVVLAGVPRMMAINAIRDIDPADSIETLSDLETWAVDYHAWAGVYRIGTLGWLAHHLRGQLFKLGRLEYLPGSYYHPFRWYRHRATGQVVALAEEGLMLREDGQFANADNDAVGTGLWTTTLEGTLAQVTGYPVSPRGFVQLEAATLKLDEWWEVLRQGDPVMTVHIPSKGRMGPEECGASFRQAVEFYRRHFPDVVWRAFTCHSWLLDPQFEQMTPAPPNIVAWLREWYLHPAQGANDQQTWERTFDLFGRSQPDWGHAEPKSSLQRALVDYVKAGGHPRSGASVLFAEDLDWGKQVYRVD